MTRKHYQKAAAIVATLAKEASKKEAHTTMLAFIAFFLDDNPRFDESRFRQACQAKVSL